MESYETLLDKAYQKVKVVTLSKDRFDIPKVTGQIEGKATIITNFKVIVDYLRRPADQVAKFLQKQLASNGKIDGDRLIFNTKMNSQKVNEKIAMYADEFVICPTCKKPDTEIESDKGIKSKHCLACGARSPLKQF
ncbi:translation initiation factor IF-2 subunit beta [Candidatus Pacearchaeota archaeon]|nr:translation initiation factor IF-2 subunit beta [Candidatus Pacearchaeota archaeon]